MKRRILLVSVLILPLALILIAQTPQPGGAGSSASWLAPVAFSSIPSCAAPFWQRLNDSVYDLVYCDGSALHYYIGGAEVTPVTIGDFTTLNSPTHESTWDGGGAVWVRDTNTASNLAGYYIASPGSTWTVTAVISPRLSETTTTILGLAIMDATSTEMDGLFMRGSAISNTWQVVGHTRYATPSAAASDIATVNNQSSLAYADKLWLRLDLASGTLTESISTDGAAFRIIDSASATALLENIDRIGLFFDARTASESGLLWLSWEVD